MNQKINVDKTTVNALYAQAHGLELASKKKLVGMLLEDLHRTAREVGGQENVMEAIIKAKLLTDQFDMTIEDIDFMISCDKKASQ